MCSPHPADYYCAQKFFLFVAAGGICTYDLLIGTRPFLQWIKKPQSLKGLGAIVSAICLVAGALYANSPFFVVQAMTMLAILYPLIEFWLKKKKTRWGFIWRLPMVSMSAIILLIICLNAWSDARTPAWLR